MKMIITCLLAVAAIAASAQTTEEEYNYLTKGYKLDLENGRDIKSGYTLEKFYERTVDTYNYTFHAFRRSDNSMAALLIIAQDKGMFGITSYLCVPIDNAQLEAKFFKEVNSKLIPQNARNLAFVLSMILAEANKK